MTLVFPLQEVPMKNTNSPGSIVKLRSRSMVLSPYERCVLEKCILFWKNSKSYISRFRFYIRIDYFYGDRVCTCFEYGCFYWDNKIFSARIGVYCSSIHIHADFTYSRNDRNTKTEIWSIPFINTHWAICRSIERYFWWSCIERNGRSYWWSSTRKGECSRGIRCSCTGIVYFTFFENSSGECTGLTIAVPVYIRNFEFYNMDRWIQSNAHSSISTLFSFGALKYFCLIIIDECKFFEFSISWPNSFHYFFLWILIVSNIQYFELESKIPRSGRSFTRLSLSADTPNAR